jgi:hypothetical protein
MSVFRKFGDSESSQKHICADDQGLECLSLSGKRLACYMGLRQSKIVRAQVLVRKAYQP